jgi:dihydroorotate dehydrogenase electron transfer subunit
MRIVPIERTVREVHHTTTYFFRAPFAAKPGQFVMVWIPGHDELPMALSYLDDPKGITVHAYGDATQAFAKFEPGRRIGIRGPYGNSFSLAGERTLAVAGGTGMASLIAAVEAYGAAGKEIVTAVGARTKDELLFVERAGACGTVHIATDDGSAGFAGYVPALAKKLMDAEAFDFVLTCGPEVMMKQVVDLANERGVACEASLERYMKCGVGICDACAFDASLVCLDGPVFSGAFLKGTEDFGRWRRDASGRRVPL